MEKKTTVGRGREHENVLNKDRAEYPLGPALKRRDQPTDKWDLCREEVTPLLI